MFGLKVVQVYQVKGLKGFYIVASQLSYHLGSILLLGKIHSMPWKRGVSFNQHESSIRKVKPTR